MLPHATVALAILLLGAAAGIAYASHRRKAKADGLPLIGSRAIVHQSLNPKGTVIVRGELWNARSRDGHLIASRARVTIVQVENHELIVEPQLAPRHPSSM